MRAKLGEYTRLTQPGEESETIILLHNRAPDKFTSREIELSSELLITLICTNSMSLLHLHSRFDAFEIAPILLLFFICKFSAKYLSLVIGVHI